MKQLVRQTRTSTEVDIRNNSVHPLHAQNLTLNIGSDSFSPLAAGLPEGVPRKRANDPEILAQLRTEWASMSEEEKEKRTDGRVKEITEDKQTRLTGMNNTGILAFHDAVGTLRAVENLVRGLYHFPISYDH